MKLLKITFLMTVCLYLFMINYNYVNAAFSISTDRSDFIKAQLDRRSTAITKEMTEVANKINDVFSTAYGGLFFGFSTGMNTLSGLFGILNFAIPCGGAAVISSAVLGITQNFVESSHSGDIGYTILQGARAVMKQEISYYNTEELAAKIKFVHGLQNGFYTDGTSLGYITTLNNALNLNTQYAAMRSFFEIEAYQLDSIGLYTLYANAHLLYLYDMVVSGPNYNFTQSDLNNFYGKFTEAVLYYRSYIDLVDAKGRAELENNGVSGKSNQDEWNIRNDYYNYMKIFVYDISNYWDYLDPVKFSTGVFLENAHVSLSNLFGAPYNGDNHMVSSDIDSYLNGKNAYQYQGKLTGIYYKNFPCQISSSGSFTLVKYFGGRQFFFREGVEKDTFYLGDTGSSYPLLYKGVNELSSVTQFNARDGNPETRSRDFDWGLNVSNTIIGNNVVYNTKELIQYPQKVAALALPLSYNLCRAYCYDTTTIYLVESAVIGFVNGDVSNDNIVFELTSSMIDAQKYNYIYPQTGYYYSRDGYQRYKHSMYIPANSLITYKIQYTPYNKQPGSFKLYLDFKPVTSGTTNVKVYNSKYDFECLNQVINKDSTTAYIQEVGNMILNPSNLADNYVTVQFSKAVYFQNLLFRGLE